jgi:hypothetical protein
MALVRTDVSEEGNVIHSSEMLDHTRATWGHIPEEGILQVIKKFGGMGLMKRFFLYHGGLRKLEWEPVK